MSFRAMTVAVALAFALTGCSFDSVLGEADIPTPSITISQATEPPPPSEVADVVERVLPSVVNIRVEAFAEGSTEEVRGEGSGVVIDESGVIMTNAHVVQNAFTVEVRFNDDHEPLEGEVLGTVPEQDIAIVKVDADDLDPIVVGRSDSLRLGDSVVAVGFPLGLGGPTVTSGIVSGEDRTINPQGGPALEGMLQTDAAINPGNSGGALVDLNGNLIGINTAAAGASAAENVGFAIPIDSALPIAEEILAEPPEERAWLGVLLREVDPAIAVEIGVDADTEGMLIVDVIPDGPAEDAGIEPGVVLTAIEGQSITSFADVTRVLRDFAPGDEVTLDLVGPDGTDSVEVQLDRRPPTIE